MSKIVVSMIAQILGLNSGYVINATILGFLVTLQHL